MIYAWSIFSLPVFFIIIQCPAILLGWVVVPVAIISKAYESYEGKDGVGTLRKQYRFTWKWVDYVWGNYEDGIANDTYKNGMAWPLWRKIFYWSVIRNPANNLRIVPILSCLIDPKRVKFVGSLGKKDPMQYDNKKPLWFFAWHGLYSNFYWQFNLFGKLRRLWVGWKIMPKDIYGVSTYRKLGAGFATQFKVVK